MAVCRIPGMSIASMARNRGINYNILHRWLRELLDSAQPRIRSAVDVTPPGFIELPKPVAFPAPSPSTTEGCEGFFRRLKIEMFYSCDWLHTTIDDFVACLDAYIRWYNEARINILLGARSPIEHRRSLGIAV